MQGLRFFLALWLSKLTAIVIDLIAKGRGTNLPGAVALKIDPKFLSHIRGIDPEKTVFLTGTNGKSTTTNLLSRVLSEAGFCVVSNLGGANMTAGVAVPLLRNCSLGGKLRGDYVVMETDERYVASIRQQIPGKYLCITNIQKDQVQRNGEPSFIREKIRQAIHSDMTLFLNQDEPNTFRLKDAGAERVVSYGVAPHEKSFRKEDDFFAVSMPCPVCHSSLVFHQYNLDNVGAYHCPDCGLNSETAPDCQLTDISFADKTFCIDGVTYPFHCNMAEFLYSYALSAAVAREFGIDTASIVRAFEKFRAPNGRGAERSVGAHKVRFFRMKQENSETLQSAVNMITADSTDKTLLFGFDEYIDFYPPYINGCYLFDCSFKKLRESGVKDCICTAPALGHCGALRFLYDGFPAESISVLSDSSEQELAAALDKTDCKNAYLIEEIPFWMR